MENSSLVIKFQRRKFISLWLISLKISLLMTTNFGYSLIRKKWNFSNQSSKAPWGNRFCSFPLDGTTVTSSQAKVTGEGGIPALTTCGSEDSLTLSFLLTRIWWVFILHERTRHNIFFGKYVLNLPSKTTPGSKVLHTHSVEDTGLDYKLIAGAMAKQKKLSIQVNSSWIIQVVTGGTQILTWVISSPEHPSLFQSHPSTQLPFHSASCRERRGRLSSGPWLTPVLATALNSLVTLCKFCDSYLVNTHRKEKAIHVNHQPWFLNSQQIQSLNINEMKQNWA